MSMSNLAGPPKVPTIRELAAELARLRDCAEDLEDARELDAAIQRNGDNPPSLGKRPRKTSACRTLS